MTLKGNEKASGHTIDLCSAVKVRVLVLSASGGRVDTAHTYRPSAS